MLYLRPLISLMQSALECSIYLAPDAPGLTLKELVEVGSRLGHQEGEIKDALAAPTAYIEARGERYLLDDGIMTVYYNFHQPEEPDYRPIDALNFLHSRMADRSKEVGARNAAIERSVIAQQAMERGISRADIEAAITLAILCGIMVEQQGTVRFVHGKDGYPSPSQQREQSRDQINRSPVRQPNRARVYPIVKDVVARRSDKRPQHAEPFAAFADQIDSLGYGQFRMWWTLTVAELQSSSSENRPLSVCVLAASLLEGALTFVVRHARKQNMSVFRSSEFEKGPRTWTINSLVASAASGGPAAILNATAKARAETLCRTRQRIHAGRMLEDYPTGVPDLRPEEARDAKATAELVVRCVLDWLAACPPTK